jgi:hypothetical protein
MEVVILTFQKSLRVLEPHFTIKMVPTAEHVPRHQPCNQAARPTLSFHNTHSNKSLVSTLASSSVASTNHGQEQPTIWKCLLNHFLYMQVLQSLKWKDISVQSIRLYAASLVLTVLYQIHETAMVHLDAFIAPKIDFG